MSYHKAHDVFFPFIAKVNLGYLVKVFWPDDGCTTVNIITFIKKGCFAGLSSYKIVFFSFLTNK